MRRLLIIITAALLFILPMNGYSQFRKGVKRNTDTELHKKEYNNTTVIADTVKGNLPKPKLKEAHSPHKATIYAMVLPGLGQIYNKQYWKLPLLYGGIAATVYGLNWNADMYNKYKDAFVDYVAYTKYQDSEGTLPEPTSTRWDKIYKGQDVADFSSSDREWFMNKLKNKKDSYKRDRNLMYIVMVGIYALNIIDATVYANFYNFDISDDLSMGVTPSLNSDITGTHVGVNLSFKF